MPQTMQDVVDPEPGPEAGLDGAARECLQRVLDGGTEPERCRAVQALGRIGGAEAAHLLINQLRDPDPDVRSDTAAALAQIGDDRAIAPLIANLKADPVGEIKFVYVRTLQALGARESVPILTVLATGRGEHNGIDWEDDYAQWDDWLDVQSAAIEALGVLARPEADGDVIKAIVAALIDPDGQDLWAVGTRALIRLGLQGCTALDKLAAQASALNRKRIARALADAPGRRGEDLLMHLAKDEDAGVRCAAFKSAAQRGLPSLCHQGLNDERPEVRASVVSSLGALDRKAIAAALDDVSPKVVIAACRAIENAGVPLPGLGLRVKAERALRSGSPEYLAALVAALAVAEPAEAPELIEDVVNHRATAALVRCACLRVLGKLNGANAAHLLATAVADPRQDIRFEAIAALECIAKGEGALAQQAVALLASAISGDLVTPPPDWKPEEDKVVHLSPRKGAQAAGEDGGATIQLDRAGNIVDKQIAARGDDELPAAGGDEEAEQDEAALDEAVASSTLEAILAFQPAPAPPKNDVEFSEQDLTFLELTGSRPGRRRASPEATIPAHIDVRRLAARMAGGTRQAELVPALAEAAGHTDIKLAEAAMEALRELAIAGIDIGPAQTSLLRQTMASNHWLRVRAINALSKVKSDAAANAIMEAVGDAAGTVRAAGVRAAAGDHIRLDLRTLIQDRDRAVRMAAAGLVARRRPAGAVQMLLEFARVDGAVHKFEAARLLAPFGAAAADEVICWINGSDRRKKLIGLEMLPALLRPDPVDV